MNSSPIPSSSTFIFIILFGLLFAAIGIGLGIGRKKKKERCTDPVNAVVIDNIRRSTRSSKGHRSVTYAPVFRYYYNGSDYTTESNCSSNPPVFRVGEETEIFVDPNSPQKIFVPKDKTTVILSVIFTIVGFVIIAAGIFMYVSFKQTNLG